MEAFKPAWGNILLALLLFSLDAKFTQLPLALGDPNNYNIDFFMNLVVTMIQFYFLACFLIFLFYKLYSWIKYKGKS